MTPTPVGSKCYLEVEHFRVNLNHIHLRRIELNTVSCFCIFRKTIYKVFITTTLLCQMIQTLCIVDPQCHIPGLIIVPPIIRNIKGIELIGCGGHLGLGSAHTIGTLSRPPKLLTETVENYFSTGNLIDSYSQGCGKLFFHRLPTDRYIEIFYICRNFLIGF